MPSTLIGKKRGRDHVTRATESTASLTSSEFMNQKSTNKKSKDKKNNKVSKYSNISTNNNTNDQKDNTPIVEDEPSNNKSGGFGSALSKILSRDIGNKKTPVLSKRHTALQKLQEQEKLQQLLLKKQNKQKKILRKVHNLDPRQAAPDFERQLRKVATKGVVALFNAIAKHQHSVEIAEQEANRTSEKVKIVAAKQASFLDLLKTGVQEQGKPTMSSTTTTLSSSKGNNNNKGGWSVLSDSMVNMAGKMKKTTKTTTFSDDDNDNDEDDNMIPDVLASESDDDNEY